MKAVDCKLETWENVRKRVDGARMEVYRLLQAHGPCPSRLLSARSGHIPIISLRPRITELQEMGLARCVGRARTPTGGSEGVFEAVSMEEAERIFERRKQAASGQGVLF